MCAGDPSGSPADDGEGGSGAARDREYLLPSGGGAREGIHLYDFGLHEGSGELVVEGVGRASGLCDVVFADGKFWCVFADNPLTHSSAPFFAGHRLYRPDQQQQRSRC